MEKRLDEAVSSLEILPESEEKSYLVKLARFVGERTY
jgi:geranylgeranyl pyrophosphate synthase